MQPGGPPPHNGQFPAPPPPPGAMTSPPPFMTGPPGTAPLLPPPGFPGSKGTGLLPPPPPPPGMDTAPDLPPPPPLPLFNAEPEVEMEIKMEGEAGPLLPPPPPPGLADVPNGGGGLLPPPPPLPLVLGNGSTNGSTNGESDVKPILKMETDVLAVKMEGDGGRTKSPSGDDIKKEAQQYGAVFAGPGAKINFTRPMVPPILPKLSFVQQELVTQAKKYAMETSIKSVLVKQTLAHQQQKMATLQNSIQKQQALALMCRIYVGSINFELREDTIKQAFNPFGPIKNVSLSWDPQLNKHKGFAFVEYEIPESANLALDQMNGVMMGGRNIKVGRPSNMPQAQPIIEALAQDAHDANRIFIASIHSELTEADVRSVFEAFGKINSCQLAPAPVGGSTKHRGFGFIEYETQQAAVDAISSMNLFDLGGQYLRVGKAITTADAIIGGAAQPLTQTTLAPMPTAAAVAAAAATAKIQAMETTEAPKVVVPKLGSPAVAVIPPPAVVTIPSLSAASSMIPPPAVINPARTTAGIATATAMAPAVAAQPGVGKVASLMDVKVVPTGALAQTQAALAAAAQAAQAAAIAAGLTGPDGEVIPEKKPEEEAEKSIQAQEEGMKVSGSTQRHMVMQKLMSRKLQSRVVVLRNMVGPEEIDEELEDEVTSECETYGTVDRVIIYQERQGEEEDAEILIKIFVEFGTPQAAEKAINSLNGRFFGGRIVKAELYDQGSFDVNDLSG